MDLLLRRTDLTATRTIGELWVDGVRECYTLEDPVRDGPKVAHETAIPVGRYEVVITKSQRFGVMLPLVLDVPGFEGIRIHAGNTSADTSGCILVGQDRVTDALLRSRRALTALQAQLAHAIAEGERVWLDVRNPPPHGTLVA